MKKKPLKLDSENVKKQLGLKLNKLLADYLCHRGNKDPDILKTWSFFW